MSRNSPLGRRLTSPWAASVILLLFFTVMLSSLSDKSIVFDEIAHITAGYSYWQDDDFRLQPENGNLPQRLEALPLLLGHYTFPAHDSLAWKMSDEWSLGYEWLYREGNNAETMVAWGRAAAGLVAVALGALVWAWSRSLFGPAAGMLSLLLYITNPNILANGALMTSDMACAFFMLAAIGAWGWCLRRLSLGRVLGSAVVTGCALASKASGVLVLPVLVLLLAGWLIFERRNPAFRSRSILRGLAMLLLYAGTAAAVVWAFYGFRYAAMSPVLASDSRLAMPWATLLQGDGSPSLLRSLVGFAREGHLLPEGYLYGLVFVTDFSQHRSGFLNGEISLNGWSCFFPYAFLVKNPLAVFIFLGWAGTLLVGQFRLTGGSSEIERQKKFAIISLLLLLAIYGGMALMSHLNIGLRHLLPLYAPLFILCGIVVAERTSASTDPAEAPRPHGVRLKHFVVPGLMAILLVETIGWYPNYLAYFNALAGGSSGGYRHLVDSSLDWGQDLPAAARYIRDHPADGPFYLSYFGNGSPAHDGIKATLLYSVPGWDALPLAEVAKEDNAPIPLNASGNYDLIKPHASSGPVRPAIWLRESSQLRMRGGTYLVSATMLQPVLYSPQNGPWGLWNWRYETTYRDLQAEMQPLLSDVPDVRSAALFRHSPAEWNAVWSRYDEFQFARLSAYLRQREPSVQIGGGSILIYRLTDGEIAQALDGPPPEIKPDPRWTTLTP